MAGLEVLALDEEGELFGLQVHVVEAGQEAEVRLVVVGVGRAQPQPLRQRVQREGREDQRNAEPQQPLAGEAARAAALKRVPGTEAGDEEQQRHGPDDPEPSDDHDGFGGLGVLDVEVVVGSEYERRVKEDQPEHDQHPDRVQLRPPLR